MTRLRASQAHDDTAVDKASLPHGGLLLVWLVLGSTIPSRIDSPTVTDQRPKSCFVVFAVGTSPNMPVFCDDVMSACQILASYVMLHPMTTVRSSLVLEWRAMGAPYGKTQEWWPPPAVGLCDQP